jgi:hypothetical protein
MNDAAAVGCKSVLMHVMLKVCSNEVFMSEKKLTFF